MSEQHSNSVLRKFYDQSYKTGEADVFIFFENGKHISEDHPAVLAMDAELVTTVDRHCAYGPRLLKDFDKRLRNALRDAKLPTAKVDDYMKHLNNLVQHLETGNAGAGLDGATAFYRLQRK